MNGLNDLSIEDRIQPEPKSSYSVNAIPKVEIDNRDLSKFQEYLQEDMNYVFSNIETKITDQKKKEEFLKSIMVGDPVNTIQKITEIADLLRIDEMKKNDPTFTPQSSFVRGVDSTVTLGLGATAIDAMAGTQERARLLKKAFPKTNLGGEIVGFASLLFGDPLPLLKAADKLTAGELLAKGGAGLFEVGSLAKQSVSKFAQKMIDAGGKKTLGEMLQKAAMSNGFISKAVELGAGESLFSTAKEGVSIVNDRLSDRPIGDPAQRLTTAATEGFESGAKFSVALSGLGAAASVGRKTLQKGFNFLSPVPPKYIAENLDVITEVLEKNPEMFMAQESKKIFDASRKYEGVLKTEEGRISQAIKDETKQFYDSVNKEKLKIKDSIISTYNKDSANLEQVFSETGLKFSDTVKELAKANANDSISIARELAEKVEKGKGQINKNYKIQLDSAIDEVTSLGKDIRISNQPILNEVETFLKSKGAMTEAGVPLPKSAWAEYNQSLFGDMVASWERFGGKTVLEGGNAGTTSLQDAVNIKRGLGESANFGKSASQETYPYRKLFFSLKDQTEIALPKLKSINETYSKKREIIDSFENKIGKDSDTIAGRFIDKIDDVSDRAEKQTGKNLEIGSVFKAIGEINPELALGVKKTYDIKERVNVLSRFTKNPKTVINELRQAYIGGDVSIIRDINRIVEKYPKLAPYARMAEKQARMVKNMSDAHAVKLAALDDQFAMRLQTARPDLQPLVDNLNALKQQRLTFNKTFPTTPQAMEQKLSTQGYLEKVSDLEQRQLLEQASPEIRKSFERADVGRKVMDVQQGRMPKSELENIPLANIGQTFTMLKNKVAPTAFRLIVNYEKMSKPMQETIGNSVLGSLRGTEAFPKEKIINLSKIIGLQSALSYYAQNGGEDDLANAINAVAKDLTILKEE